MLVLGEWKITIKFKQYNRKDIFDTGSSKTHTTIRQISHYRFVNRRLCQVCLFAHFWEIVEIKTFSYFHTYHCYLKLVINES